MVNCWSLYTKLMGKVRDSPLTSIQTQHDGQRPAVRQVPGALR